VEINQFHFAVRRVCDMLCLQNGPRSQTFESEVI